MIRIIFMGTLFLIRYAVLQDINTIIKTGIVAPGVNVNSGARDEMSVSGATNMLMELLVMIGLVVMTASGNLQLNISASALGASSRLQEEEKMASSK